MKPPEIAPVTDLSEDAQKACYELVAELLRRRSVVLNVDLSDVKYDGQPIGNYEVSIRRTDQS